MTVFDVDLDKQTATCVWMNDNKQELSLAESFPFAVLTLLSEADLRSSRI